MEGASPFVIKGNPPENPGAVNATLGGLDRFSHCLKATVNGERARLRKLLRSSWGAEHRERKTEHQWDKCCTHDSSPFAG